MTPQKITTNWIKQARQRGDKIAALTAYDYPTARLLDEVGIPLLLVGDSVGMVMLGFPDTTHVTLAHMLHHTAAVARAKPRALIVADLPYQTYPNPAEALVSARFLMEAGAEAVKLEGGIEMEEIIRVLVQDNIPVMGHLGMLPQSIHKEGGVYRLKGKTEVEMKYLHDSIRLFERLGVFATVLELVKAEVAKEITNNYQIATIGIGSGDDCDGQVLVTPDLIGLFPWFRPKFVKPEAEISEHIQQAAKAYMKRVAGHGGHR